MAYEDIQSFIDQAVKDKVEGLVAEAFAKWKDDALYNVPVTPYHTHNGIDSPVLPFPSMSVLLAVIATTGYFFLPTCSGAPTGTPVGGAGAAIFDKTNNKLYIYNGSAWKSVTLT